MSKFGNVCILLLLCDLCACIKEDLPERTGDLQVGDRIPVFTVSNGTGEVFSSAAFAGKRSLLVLFHTGCKDCRRELPVVNKVWETLQHEENYQVVTIAREESLSSVTIYWEEQFFSMPFYLDPDRSVFSLFASGTIPRLYIVNSEGIVEWMTIETLDGMNDEELLRLVKPDGRSAGNSSSFPAAPADICH